MIDDGLPVEIEILGARQHLVNWIGQAPEVKEETADIV